jgi:hypothetical protein
MKLQDFLVKAKINTYASKGESKERKLKDGSKELIYKNANLMYRDRYFGFNPFIGEEIVWENGKAIWGMNYYGRILSNKIDSEQLYGFLKKAMCLVKTRRPFRGPTCFQEGEWDYKDKSHGTVSDFKGTEIIFFKKKKVYELKYHGGNIA